MQKSIARNYIYNLFYQILAIILPLITIPYLSRVLGAEGIGIYSYVIAITAYFILLGTLGVNLYGQKEIAYVQDDIRKRSQIFYEILFIKAFTLTLSLIIFLLTFATFGQYQLYYKILIIEIVGNIFDISWFFQGMEEFKKTVTRNTIIKIIATILIFILIKDISYLALYFLIYALSIFIGNLSLWVYLPKYIVSIKFKSLKFIYHLKPTLFLFIPQAAIQIYTVLDKSMIGIIISDISEVGYFDNAQKIIKVGITLVTSLGIVMLPRISNCYAKGEDIDIKNHLYNSFVFVQFLAFPLIFGILATVDQFVPIFFGNGFQKTAILIKIISPVILLMGITNVIGIQYLLPTKKTNYYTLSVISGAVINILFNSILINLYKSIGAGIASVLAEFSVLVVQMYFVRKDFNFKRIFKPSLKYLMAGTIMFIACNTIGYYIDKPFMAILIKVILGSTTYILILIILKDQLATKIIFNLKLRYHKILEIVNIH